MSVSLAQAAFSVAAGSLSTISPCVFPMLPVVVGGALQANRLGPAAMGLGMTASFALMGMLLGALGPALGLDGDHVRTAGAVAMIIFALLMVVPGLGARVGQWFTPLANRANAASGSLNGASITSAFLLGTVLGLVWSPCSGPLLGSALTMVATKGGVLPGGLMLGLFGLGAAMPLVAVAYASRAGFTRAQHWLQRHGATLNLIFAAVLAALGVAILTGTDKWLEAKLTALLPDGWVSLMVAF
jgi:cytochrome c-type biogenesis protein